MAHTLSNRGKLRLLQGKWDDTGGTTLKIGLLSGASVPGALTSAAIADCNTVADLLALSGVVEGSGGSYARQTITRTAATEDDTNDRINMDASDVSFGAVTGFTTYGVFWYSDGASDAARDLYGVDAFTAVTLNGAGFTYAIADLVRAS